jgi:hypothetical protein
MSSWVVQVGLVELLMRAVVRVLVRVNTLVLD